MPYKFELEKFKIPKEKDRRIKLTEEDKQSIRMEWNPNPSTKDGKQEGSIHSLAKKYGVSRRLISSIVRNKPIKQLSYEEKKEIPSSSRERRNQKAKEHRAYKNDLFKTKENKKMNKLEKLDDLLRTHYTDNNEKEKAVLDALQTIYGTERGSLDYVGYKISGNYKMNVDHAIEFIKDELNLKEEIEEEDEIDSSNSSNSL